MKCVWMIVLALLSAATPTNKPAELIQKSKVTLPDVVTKSLPEVKEGTPFFAKLKEEKGKVVYTVSFAQGTSSVKLSAVRPPRKGPVSSPCREMSSTSPALNHGRESAYRPTYLPS